MAPAQHSRSRTARELRVDLLNLTGRLESLEDFDSSNCRGLRGQPDEVSESLGLVLDRLSSTLASDGDRNREQIVIEVIDFVERWDQNRVRALIGLDGAVTDALDALNGLRDRAELVEQVRPEAARAFESGTALLAFLTADTWSAGPGYPQKSQLGPAGPDEIPLADMPVETEVIRAARAVALKARPRSAAVELPETLRQITESGSHIVAPVIIGQDVVALLYLPEPSGTMISPDEYLERVQRFASGFGFVLERELLYDRFRSQRTTIRATMSSMERIMSSLDTGVDLVRLAGRAHVDAEAAIELPLHEVSSRWDEVLTSREQDVMRLLVLGHDNTAIAAQLAVAPSTAKSHVGNAMRKLGAVNRTELISLYYGGADAGGPQA